MTNAKDMLEKIAESLGTTASVKSVFGEPIQCEGKIVVPVAKVAYGFGAGAGSGEGKPGEKPGGSGEGGGGGGGVRAYPAGALEITPTSTRFIAYNDWRWLLGAVTTGVMIGRLLTRRKS